MAIKNVSKRDCPTLENICYLISYDGAMQDNIGNPIRGNPTFEMCFCAEASAYSYDFFKAGEQGFKAETVLIVDSESYNNQLKVSYNDAEYTVYRTYPRPDGMTELHLKGD